MFSDFWLFLKHALTSATGFRLQFQLKSSRNGVGWRKAAKGQVSFTEMGALETDSVEPWTGFVKLKNHSFLHFKVDSVRIFTKPAPVSCGQVWVLGVAASAGRPWHSSPQPSIPAPPGEYQVLYPVHPAPGSPLFPKTHSAFSRGGCSSDIMDSYLSHLSGGSPQQGIVPLLGAPPELLSFSKDELN